MNMSDIARSSKIPHTTVQRYLSVLESLYTYITFPSWSGNHTKRFVKVPKVHICDTGLLCYLLKIDQKGLLNKPSLLGHILETFVVMELKKQQGYAQIRTDMYYYRTRGREEIDILLEARGGDLLAVGVKASRTLNSSDYQYILALQKDHKPENVKGIVLYPGKEVFTLGKNLLAVPIVKLWNS